MLGCLEQMVETCLEMKAQLEQERERREKKRDERKEAKERRDKEEPKKGKEFTTTITTTGAGACAGASACVYAYGEHPTVTDVETHCVLKHVDKAYAQKWLDFIASEGWHFASGAIVTRSNFRTSFNAWYRRERQHEREFSTTSSTPAKSWKEREFEAREAEIKQRQEEADRKAREEGLRILDEIKRNGGL